MIEKLKLKKKSAYIMQNTNNTNGLSTSPQTKSPQTDERKTLKKNKKHTETFKSTLLTSESIQEMEFFTTNLVIKKKDAPHYIFYITNIFPFQKVLKEDQRLSTQMHNGSVSEIFFFNDFDTRKM